MIAAKRCQALSREIRIQCDTLLDPASFKQAAYPRLSIESRDTSSSHASCLSGYPVDLLLQKVYRPDSEEDAL